MVISGHVGGASAPSPVGGSYSFAGERKVTDTHEFYIR